MLLSGYALSGTGKVGRQRKARTWRAFVIIPPEFNPAFYEPEARARFKEYFGIDADHRWDEAFEHPHVIITADCAPKTAEAKEGK